MTRRGLALALAALSGCTLIDQRTFDQDAGKPPERPKPPPVAAAPPPPEPGRTPLLTIRLPATDALRGDVAKAVAAAKARKPGVVFDVVEITPDAGTAIGADAEAVARLITAQGIPAQRVHLAARPLPNIARMVRVYVR